MSERILFVFEGKKTEPQILNNLKSVLSKNKFDLYICYATHIYSLYNRLKEDDNLDIIELLREKNKKELEKISRLDIALVYLFFDYDPQACRKCDEIIPQMLEKFDNETENGKLFISYPMVEALKDTASLGFLSDKNRVIKIIQSKNYKEIVHNKITTQLRNLNLYDTSIWKTILKQNLQQVNWILSGDDCIPDITKIKKITQGDIYTAEYNKFISTKDEIAILSAFPLFIIDYFEKEFIEKTFI